MSGLELSSALVKSLAAVTNDSTSSSTSSTAYGTAVVSGEKVYVQLDGSSILTSIAVAADARTGDRVLVSIENHVATIVSNLTTPASGYTASETEKTVNQSITVLKNGMTSIYCSETAPSTADFTLVANDLWYKPTTTTDDSGESHTSYTLYQWTVNEDTTSTWTLVQYGTDSIAAKAILADNISVATLAAISTNLGSITGGSLNIGNGTFAVDSDGNLTAESGRFNGKVISGEGIIGGFTLSSTKLLSTNKIVAYESNSSDEDDEVGEWTGESYSEEADAIVSAFQEAQSDTVNVLSSDCSDDDSAFLAVAVPASDDGTYNPINGSAYILHDGRVKVASLSCFGNLRAYGDIYTDYNLYVANNRGLWIENSSGTYARTVWLNTNNNVGVGPKSRDYGLYLWGSTIYANNLRVPEIQHGYVDIPPTSAGTTTSATVTFDAAFSGTPTVTATVQTTVPNSRAVGVLSISATGFTVYIYSSGSSNVRVHWIAVY